ncbi:MAG: hypothetical protein AAGF32_04265 [Pseudomonadota bacterium]
MTQKPKFQFARRLFKFFVLGTFVASRTASGDADPQDTLRHEQAWMNVRDRLSTSAAPNALPPDLAKLIAQPGAQNLAARVSRSYGAIEPANIAQLDALWMEHLTRQGVGAAEMDTFLSARTVALRETIDAKAKHRDGADGVRDAIIQYARSAYTG